MSFLCVCMCGGSLSKLDSLALVPHWDLSPMPINFRMGRKKAKGSTSWWKVKYLPTSHMVQVQTWDCTNAKDKFSYRRLFSYIGATRPPFFAQAIYVLWWLTRLTHLAIASHSRGFECYSHKPIWEPFFLVTTWKNSHYVGLSSHARGSPSYVDMVTWLNNK